MHRRRREVRDANGNRILRVVKRDATEMAEVETTEKIIQVKKNLELLQNLKNMCECTLIEVYKPSLNICGCQKKLRNTLEVVKSKVISSRAIF